MVNNRGYITIVLLVTVGVLGVAAQLLLSKNAALQRDLAQARASAVLWRDAAEACSKGVEDAQKAAQERANRAVVALEAARKGQVATKAELERLKALMGQKPTTDCPAGEAAARVREGLSGGR